MKAITIILISLCLISCAGIPEGVEPVSDFDLKKYSGKWYEIARLDHRFERDLEKVTATYSINEDGSVRIENRGFSTKTNEWKDAIGKAKFEGNENIGYLKVSFFGPYLIFDLDKENYQYSFVTGSDNSLWFLSRTPTVSDQLKEKFIKITREAGYKTEELIFVNQE